MMTRKERLLATLRGEVVDRPAVNFYEIGGWELCPDDPDPFSVYNGPGWRELIELAEMHTDLIRMVGPRLIHSADNPGPEFRRSCTTVESGTRREATTLNIAGHVLTQRTRRDAAVATVWTTEHFLKTREDVLAYLSLPEAYFNYDVDIAPLQDAESRLGDRGIVMVDIADPLCAVASLFSMADFTIFAFTEPALFHQLLEQHSASIYRTTEIVARTFPGHLWRIVGSEYASEPFLPPHLYQEYEARYTQPMIAMIQRHGGYARLHSHGRLRNIIQHIQAMGPDALDPLEPPPQGDMQLAALREQVGGQMVLFGNIEAAEIETLPPEVFQQRVKRAVIEGTAGAGRGFVLMPSACPYGREISPSVLRNYELMVEAVQGFTS